MPPFPPRLMRAVLASLSFIALGLAVIMWQTFTEMKEGASARLLHAQHTVEYALDNAHRAASTVKGALGKPCQEVEQLLREQVAIVPDVRSVNLTRGDSIYCTSLYGAYRERIDPGSYTGGRLYLMKGNPVTPDRPLIIYREQVGEDSILVGLDGHYLLYILNMMSVDSPLSLVVGRQRWQYRQAPTNRLFPLDTPGYLEQASSKYPFRIVTQVATDKYGANLWRYAKANLILHLLLGVLVGGLVFRLTGRANSPAQELRRALTKQEFIPYFQVVIDGEEKASGCEVLMRWRHPKQGLIPPDRFIPMAEASGLIIPMTRSLMWQVREEFGPQAHLLPKGFHFGINISACHCRDPGLVQDCRSFLEAFKDNPVRLVLELTERELLVVDGITERLFAELYELGVLIAIDDFGTGHSSLSYLQQFRVDSLKIDKSFVGMIGSDALSSHLVDNVIDLATRLDLLVVAEGVENEAQASYLKARGVAFQQGYLYGRPMPVTEFIGQLEA